MTAIKAEMSGTITKVLVNVGDSVSSQQDVVGMESMKMELLVSSSTAGKVGQIHVKAGDFVQEGATLITLT